MTRKQVSKEKLNPDELVLTTIQQKRFSQLTGIDEKEIADKTIAQLAESLKWRVDPHFFLFEKICGQVVTQDAQGNDIPVPFATVNVEDTECNLIIYHPLRSPWCWHFPLFCHKEIVGTTTTDACGNFCLWVPRFEIEWILKWRSERICFPSIFKRPVLGDYIPNPPIPPVEATGTWEALRTLTPSVIDSFTGSQASVIKAQIYKIQNSASLGMVDTMSESLLNRRLFNTELPPPLPRNFQHALTGQNLVSGKGTSVQEAIRTALADELSLRHGAKELEKFDTSNYYGPFYRCYNIEVPVWQMVLEVPDFSFQVTQGGNTIYSGGYSGSLSNLTLVANSLAVGSSNCNIPSVPCGDEPALVLAGYMSLQDTNYFKYNANITVTNPRVYGYAVRPNAPIPSGICPNSATPAPPGSPYSYTNVETPFCGTLALSGCVDIDNAQYYQVQRSIDGGATWVPITGLSWNNFLSSFPFTPITIVADTNGWYPVEPVNPETMNPVPRTSLETPNLILNWPTPLNETDLLRIVLGDGSKSQISASDPVAITCDNTQPQITPTNLSWKIADPHDSIPQSLLGIPCPIIHRGSTPKDIEVVFEVTVSASHLRDASIGVSGCGGGSFLPQADSLNTPLCHWYENVADNNVTLYQRYALSASALPGCYTFSSVANSRAMNPSCGDGGCLIPPDWYYNPVYLWSQWDLSVAIVDED